MLKKKLIAIVAAISMVSTMAMSFITASAVEPVVTFKLALENKGVLDMTLDGQLFNYNLYGTEYYGKNIYALTFSVDGYSAKTPNPGPSGMAFKGALSDACNTEVTFDNALFSCIESQCKKATTSPFSGMASGGLTADGTNLTCGYIDTAYSLDKAGDVFVWYLAVDSAKTAEAEAAKFSFVNSVANIKEYYNGLTPEYLETSVSDGSLAVIGINEVVAPTLANFEALNAAIADADAIDADKYVSVEALNKALADAEAIDQEAETDQAKVDAAVKAINDAIAALVLKPVAITGVSIESKPAVREGYKTYGVMATVNTADSKYVQVDFVDATKLLIVDLGTVIDNVPVTFGLNIMSVPSTETISIEENGVTAINELPADETTFVKVDAE